MSTENKRRFYVVAIAAILLLLASGYFFIKYQQAVSKLSDDKKYIEKLEAKNEILQDSIGNIASVIADRGTQTAKYKETIVTLRDSLKSSQSRLKDIIKDSAERIAEIQDANLSQRRELFSEYSEKLKPIVLKYERDTVFAFKEDGQREMLTLLETRERSQLQVEELIQKVNIKTEIIANQDSIINTQASTITDYEKSVELYRQMVGNYDEQKDEYENLIDVKDSKISALKWKNRAMIGGMVISVGGIVYLLSKN